MILTAALDDAGRRLDRILRKALPDLPLSALHRFLRQGRVLVNGSPAAGNDHVPAGAVIEIIEIKRELETKRECPVRRSRTGQDGASAKLTRTKGSEFYKRLDILWEGQGLLILNKEAGLAVHGAPDSLDLRVRSYLAGKLPPSLSFKPGPLHRLDKPTSGIVVFSKTLEAARRFSALLVQGKIRKRYLAILEGEIKNDQVWEEILVRDRTARKTLVETVLSGASQRVTPDVKSAATPGASQDAAPGSAKDVSPALAKNIVPGGRRAVTCVTPLAWAEGGAFTYARLEIETGRTHQIRAQAACHGHPLAGDRKYGGTLLRGKGFFLHAAELELPEQAAEFLAEYPAASPMDIPAAKNLPLIIKAPLPDDFLKTAKRLGLL